jgi:hypothetical protein
MHKAKVEYIKQETYQTFGKMCRLVVGGCFFIAFGKYHIGILRLAAVH